MKKLSNKIAKIYWACVNKMTNKLWGIVRMSAKGKKKGIVLLSYITEPFVLFPWQSFSNIHTMYWECYEIARLFSERGYAVDIIESKNSSFIPKKNYIVCIDAEKNLYRLSQKLSKECKKVFHILISHWEAYNNAEKRRLDELEQRRGVRLLPRRQMAPSQNTETADFLEGFGNKTIFGTFAKYNKSIFFIPISTVLKFDFPETKNFERARKNFLWISGGGAVLKGLDITLEAFSMMPDLHLHICAPIYGEKDFTDEYKKELEKTPNIHVYGRLDVASTQFSKIINICGAVVYPSAGEGSSGAIVQAMHAGLVPIISHETGIQEDSGYIPLENPTPASIMQVVKDFSNMSVEKIKDKSKSIWEYARYRYTREEFSKAYAYFIDNILKI